MENTSNARVHKHGHNTSVIELIQCNNQTPVVVTTFAGTSAVYDENDKVIKNPDDLKQKLYKFRGDGVVIQRGTEPGIRLTHQEARALVQHYQILYDLDPEYLKSDLPF